MNGADWSSINRRSVLKTAGISGVAAFTGHTITRQESSAITLTGDIVRHNEESRADQWVTAWNGAGEQVGSDQFVGAERFSVTVPGGEPVSLSFYQGELDSDTAVYFDQNPDIRSLGAFKYFEDTVLDPLKLPQAHKLDIRVVDGDDNPVEAAMVRVKHEIPEGVTYTTGTTNADGRFEAPHTDPGIEVEGETTVLAAPPEFTEPFSGQLPSSVESTVVSVTDDTETVIELTEPSESDDELLFEVTLAADTSSIVPGQTFTMSPTVTNIKDQPLTASVKFEEGQQQFGNVPAPSADLSGDRFAVVSHQDDGGEWVKPSSGAGWRWDGLPPGESREPSVTVLSDSDLRPGEFTFVVHSRGNVPIPYATTTITVEEGSPVELSLGADPSSIRPSESVTLTPTLTNVTDSVVSGPSVYFQSAGSDSAATADYYGDDFAVVTHEETRGDWETEGWSWQRLSGGERRQPSVTVSAAEGIDPGEYTFLAEAFVGGSGEPAVDATTTVTIDEPENIGVSVYQSTPQTIPARPQGTSSGFNEDADKTLQQALHRIDFDSVAYNDQDSYNLEADEFVAPADGRYLLILSVAVQIEGVTVAQLNVNGSPEAYDVAEAKGGNVIDNESTPTATKVVELETGDTVVPYVSHNNHVAGFPAESETLPDQDVTYLTIEKFS